LRVLRKADILSCDQGGNGQVSFGYRDSSSGKIQVRPPSGADFLHPNKKGLIALLHLVLRITPPSAPPAETPRPAFLCTCCGKPMQVIRRRIVPSGARPRSAGKRGKTPGQAGKSPDPSGTSAESGAIRQRRRTASPVSGLATKSGFQRNRTGLVQQPVQIAACFAITI